MNLTWVVSYGAEPRHTSKRSNTLMREGRSHRVPKLLQLRPLPREVILPGPTGDTL